MNPVTTLVQTATYDLSPRDVRLSPVFWKGFILLNKVHSIWRFFRRYEVYSNPDNLIHLLAGHTLNFITGDSALLRIAAQCLLIATKILDSVESQIALNEALSLWKEAFLGHYPKPVSNHWKNAVVVSSCKIKSQHLFNRIERIFRCTLVLLNRSFRLSMRILDTIDAFTLSPYTRNDAINEGFVNAVKCIDALVDNKQALLEGCRENREILEIILAKSPLSYEQLYLGITNTLERTEKIQMTTRKITTYANGLLIDTGKRTIDEIMVSLGLSRFRPLLLT